MLSKNYRRTYSPISCNKASYNFLISFRVTYIFFTVLPQKFHNLNIIYIYLILILFEIHPSFPIQNITSNTLPLSSNKNQPQAFRKVHRNKRVSCTFSSPKKPIEFFIGFHSACVFNAYTITHDTITLLLSPPAQIMSITLPESFAVLELASDPIIEVFSV